MTTPSIPLHTLPDPHKQQRIAAAADYISLSGHLLPAAMQIVAERATTANPTPLGNVEMFARIACDLADAVAVEHLRRAKKRLEEAAK